MNRSTPGLLVHHHLPEFTQTNIHRVSDAILKAKESFEATTLRENNSLDLATQDDGEFAAMLGSAFTYRVCLSKDCFL